MCVVYIVIILNCNIEILSDVLLTDNEEMAAWLLDDYPDLARIANKNGNLAVHFAAAQGKQLHL